MSAPVCTRATLISGSACYRAPRLSTHDQTTRLVYFKMLELAAIGGTNYANAVNTLFVDANNLSCGMQPDDFIAADIRIAENKAIAAGATIPATGDAIADAIKCLKKFDDFQLKQANLLLDCLLGVSKAYPQ